MDAKCFFYQAITFFKTHNALFLHKLKDHDLSSIAASGTFLIMRV